MKYLSPGKVIAMHKQVVEPDELQGMALNKSIESVLARNDRATLGVVSRVARVLGRSLKLQLR